MGLFALLLGFFAIGSMSFMSDDDDLSVVSNNDSSNEDDQPEDEELPEDEEPPEDDALPDTPDEVEEGASDEILITETDDGSLRVNMGEDVGGSLALVNESAIVSNGAYGGSVLNLYWVPEGVEIPQTDWESRFDIPGEDEVAKPGYDYYFDDFADLLGLELLYSLPGAPAEPDMGAFEFFQSPHQLADSTRLALDDIDSNVPISGYVFEGQNEQPEFNYLLPIDFTVTSFGVENEIVTEDTIGSDTSNWFTIPEGNDDLTVTGGSDQDDLETFSDRSNLQGLGDDDALTFTNSNNTTVLGGEGDDTIRGFGSQAFVDGGDGDDVMYLFATGEIIGGDGNDLVSINPPYNDETFEPPTRIDAGDGDDTIWATGVDQATMQGGAGNDYISLSDNSEGHGDAGDDDFFVYDRGTAYGGEGDDVLRGFGDMMHLSGGEGDDQIFFRRSYDALDQDTTLTGGEGADVFRVEDNSIWQVEQETFGETIITDFDPSEDILEIGAAQDFLYVDKLEISEIAGENSTMIQARFVNEFGNIYGYTYVRLEGVTGITEDDIAFTRPPALTA